MTKQETTPKTKKPRITNYNVRNFLGLIGMSLATMGFIKQNLSGFTEIKLWAVSAVVGGLVVFFTFKK